MAQSHVHCQAVVLAVLILLISIPECCFSFVVKYNIFGSLLLISDSIRTLCKSLFFFSLKYSDGLGSGANCSYCALGTGGSFPKSRVTGV